MKGRGGRNELARSYWEKEEGDRGKNGFELGGRKKKVFRG